MAVGKGCGSESTATVAGGSVDIPYISPRDSST